MVNLAIGDNDRPELHRELKIKKTWLTKVL